MVLSSNSHARTDAIAFEIDVDHPTTAAMLPVQTFVTPLPRTTKPAVAFLSVEALPRHRRHHRTAAYRNRRPALSRRLAMGRLSVRCGAEDGNRTIRQH
jgi:hypothetical protein